MLIVNKTLYAGLTNEKALELMPCNTGYQLQRITDGQKLGVCYTLNENETPEMFIEIDDELTSDYFVKDNILIAGVENEDGFALCINRKKLNTGKTFVRIHDNIKIGNKIYLGRDYSYYKDQYRIDLPKYYLLIDDKGENE